MSKQKNIKTINDILEKGKSNCCGCYACYNICPTNAIKMVADDKGFLYPMIDTNKCINCSLCYKICPTEHVKKEEFTELMKTYAAYSKDTEERLQSSSGGVFSLLAKYILENNGIVFGAAFNGNNKVQHIGINKIENLSKLQGSKYLQSEIGDTYKEVESFLKKEKLVLFTGTPCQIEGLYSFLKKDYNNLYTQDIVCHGVPSQKVWSKHLRELEIENKIEKNDNLKIEFRNKDDSWQRFDFKITGKEKEYKVKHYREPYMIAFLQNMILRDSCYDCKFKKKYRISDIMLGDYWGVYNVEPDMDSREGTSLVNVNTEKGQFIFKKIKDKMVYKLTDFDEAVKYNPSAISSSYINENREKFFEQLNNKTVSELAMNFKRKETIALRLKRFLARIIKKIKNQLKRNS